MQLHERLMDLLGHEVAVTAQVENGVKEIAVGSLKEVGPDYLIVGTSRREQKGRRARGRGLVDQVGHGGGRGPRHRVREVPGSGLMGPPAEASGPEPAEAAPARSAPQPSAWRCGCGGSPLSQPPRG